MLRLALHLVLSLVLSQVAFAETKLLRHPDLHGDQVVFTYAGDLWLASDRGGVARRLTTHPGLELFGKFSPDGRWIAFTGQYDGDEQVYVMPVAGGSPRPLTFYPAAGPLPARWGYDNQVYEWTPDGTAVLFRSMRDGWDLGDTQLFTVPVDGGLPRSLPMPESGGGDLSPDGGHAVYSPVTRDFRHWKRYQGGWAQDLYVFDLASHDTRRITEHPRSDRDPMWIGETIYFASDRDGKLNLYAYDLASGQAEQRTQHDLWDVRWPSADKSTGRIVYELAGSLVVHDTASGEERTLVIDVPTDGLAMRPERVSAAESIEGIGLAPGGERVLFAARGDIFSAPVEHGPTRNLTRSPGAHDREPAWSPDGAWVAYVSDADGEEEIYRVDQRGRNAPEQLTDGSTGRYYGLDWSPDNRRIAYVNQEQELFVLDVESREVIEVVDDSSPFGLDFLWSPHGGHLALSLAEDNGQRSIFIWTVADRTLRRVTEPMFNERSPAWDPEGNYLYYISERELRPQLGAFEFNYVVNRASQVYALALRDDVGHPFPPRSDEVAIDEKDGKDEAGESDDGDDAKKGKKAKNGKGDEKKDADQGDPPITIDFEGLAERVTQVPLPADNYYGLGTSKGHLVVVNGPAPYYGRQGDTPFAVSVFSLEDRDSTELVRGLQQIVPSADGGKLFVQTGGGFQVLDAAPSGKGSSKTVSTSGLMVDRVPAVEWVQIFDEVWRRFRDFFYVENMHGYDWEALRAQYRPLLEHVAHRSDLNYVISEMIAELNVGHAYIAGGDYVVPDRPRAALLGARLALDSEAGRYQVSEILDGDNREPTYRSPLREVGVDAPVGTYLLGIDGAMLGPEDNPFALLRHAGGRPVELLVNDTPETEGARTILVQPISNEDDLLYHRWVARNRTRVEETSGGRLGYLHIPDMGTSGLREFIKWFYGQVRKEGLVIDVRNNGGGNVSAMILERLRRELLMVDFERNQDRDDTYPNVVFHGHLAALIDEDTASDGDQFAYVFRASGLGPLIGKRTWGGVVGIYGRGPLLDGGGLSVPEAGSADAQGRWVVEGHGVDPDVVVEQDPKKVLAGGDPQLEKAIEVLMAKIEAEPKTLPERPAPPIKTE